MVKKIVKDGLSINHYLKQWARKLKEDIISMYFAVKHPQTPLYAKLFAAMIVGYALSPIDLIPDFIPVLGYLDDVILLPACIALAIKMIPSSVLSICRAEAKNNPPTSKPKIWVAAYVILIIWFIILYALYAWVK